jgi:hypothetical protein
MTAVRMDAHAVELRPAHARSNQAVGPASMSDVCAADTPLAAVLQGKPAADEISVATWWLLAESLRQSVLVRRAAEGAMVPSTEIRLAANRARLGCEAALAELGTTPVDRRLGCAPRVGSRRAVPPPTLRITIYSLARLIVSARTTSPATLRAAILVHLEALRLAYQSGKCPVYERF